MATTSRQSRAATAARARQPRSPSESWAHRVPNPLTILEPILKRDEADLVFVAGNIALVAFEIIEWPVAALTLAAHAMARSRFKALQGAADVAEEAG
jgi:hypothetical protein